MRNKFIAGLLAIFAGTFGIHKFYLGKTLQGILHIIFAFTGLSSIIAFFEGIYYLTMSEHEFDMRFNLSGEGRMLQKEQFALEREKLKLERVRLERMRIAEEKEMKGTTAKNEVKKIPTKAITGEQADELAAWHDLLQKGIIDESEYEDKRKVILGLD
jgi:TM2 domain-containing membrane protein YozV